MHPARCYYQGACGETQRQAKKMNSNRQRVYVIGANLFQCVYLSAHSTISVLLLFIQSFSNCNLRLLNDNTEIIMIIFFELNSLHFFYVCAVVGLVVGFCVDVCVFVNVLNNRMSM